MTRSSATHDEVLQRAADAAISFAAEREYLAHPKVRNYMGTNNGDSLEAWERDYTLELCRTVIETALAGSPPSSDRAHAEREPYTPYAYEEVHKFYTEWPGGLEEIESSLKQLRERADAAEARLSALNDTPEIDAEAAWHEWRTANPNSSMYEAFLFAASLRSETPAMPAPHNFNPKRDVACTKGEYAGLVHNSRRYEYLRDHMRRMPLGEAGTRHFFDQPGTVSFQEAVDEARNTPSPSGVEEGVAAPENTAKGKER